MFVRTILAASSLWITAASAEVTSDELFDSMGLDRLIIVMAEEGKAIAPELEEGFFPGGGGNDWQAAFDQLYDPASMEALSRKAFATALEGADLDAIEQLVESDLAQKVFELEISTREAMLDEDIEESAKATAFREMSNETDRNALVKQHIEAGDLIERNVEGALNANYQFFAGLVDGGALPGMDDDMILQQVWATEPDARKDSTEWLYGFFTMAYAPLSDDELEEYTALTESEPGKALFDATFDAFNTLFDASSYRAGVLVGEFAKGQEL